MTSLNVKIENEDQGRVLLAFLNSLVYEYDVEETDSTDETAYLLSSTTMQQHLTQSIKEAKEGKVKAISIDDLWK
jgi:PHD/YefM family antitoxin component YafN of YafNO toxin-antitoxin module